MKTYNYSLKKIFDGISPNEVDRKDTPRLVKCHNLEPLPGNDYKLHEQVVDLDADDYAWGNP
jgi:hypothetical protein